MINGLNDLDAPLCPMEQRERTKHAAQQTVDVDLNSTEHDGSGVRQTGGVSTGTCAQGDQIRCVDRTETIRSAAESCGAAHGHGRVPSTDTDFVMGATLTDDQRREMADLLAEYADCLLYTSDAADE